MKTLILFVLISVTISSHSQIYIDRIGFDLESISHIDIGWMEIRKHTTTPKGKQNGDRIYSARQIENSQKMVEWMQQSYYPKGCLGNATYYQNYIPKFTGTNSMLGNAINMHLAALPHMYGAQTKIHMFLKKDANGKFIPQTSHGNYWNIEVNGLRGISDHVSFISSAEEYYFLLPDFKNNSRGYDADDKARSNLLGFDNHKNIKDFKHFFLPGRGVIAQYVVIMSKDNQLPFEEITIGEFFTEVEKNFPVWQKIDPVSADQYLVAQKNLARLKSKYKNKWNDIAQIQTQTIDIRLIDFVNATEGYNDMFDNESQTVFPILRVKKAAKELCKTDQAQWIVFRWQWGMENQQYYLHFHESILNNFNYDYVYNYFFNSEKVKGQNYKPLRSPTFKEAVVVNQASENSKKFAADKNVLFFDDFSTTSPGKKPLGWQAKSANSGTTAIVTNPEGLDGNWVMLRGHYIGSTLSNKTLSQDFTLSYDLVASQNFTWGSKSLSMLLSKDITPGNAEAFLKLRIRPGFDGRDGEVSVERKFPSKPGYSEGSKWYVATGFSNNKKNNRINVAIKKTDELLEIFIDDKKVGEYKNAIPANQIFNALSFDCNGNSAENDKYFVSNVKIVRE